MHSAEVIADSVSPAGVRLTTMVAVMPRIVLAEFNTHRVFSRNSASSRAIPVEKMIQAVQSHPYVPSSWGKNQRGMQAGEDIQDPAMIRWCEEEWLRARDSAVEAAEQLMRNANVHKQLTNRLLEPFMWHTVIVTATEWSNFFHLRVNAAAHPDIRKTAALMQLAMDRSTPLRRDYGQWHLPYVYEQERDSLADESLVKISAARCARVSYLTHDGKKDVSEDLALHDKLLSNGHMSPFEHAARPYDSNTDRHLADFRRVPGFAELSECWFGNFRGWVQYRKLIPNEHDVLGAL